MGGMKPATDKMGVRFSRSQAMVVGLMLVFSVMSYFNRTIMSIAGPTIMGEFSLSETQMGTVFSAFLFSYTILMIPGGKLADRFGPKKVLAWMAFGSGLFTAMTALGGHPELAGLAGVIPSFVVLRLAMGVATAPLYPATGKMNAEWMAPEQRGRAQGVVNAGAGLGGAVAPVLFHWMILSFGWRMSFVMAGAATVGAGLLWMAFIRDRPAERQATPAARSQGTPWRALFTNRNLLYLTLGYFMVCYFEYIFFYWIYYYLGKIRGLGEEQSAVYTTALFLTWFVMMPMGGWASDRAVARWGSRRGMRIVGISGLALAAVLLWAAVNTSGTASAVALMSLALGFAACSDVVFWAAVMEIAGRDVGAACGILNTGGNVGGFIAPMLTPWIATFAGWSGGLYFGSAMAMLGALTWLGFNPASPRAGHAGVQGGETAAG